MGAVGGHSSCVAQGVEGCPCASEGILSIVSEREQTASAANSFGKRRKEGDQFTYMSEERGHAHETQALERTQSEESIIGDFAKFGAANRFNQNPV